MWLEKPPLYVEAYYYRLQVLKDRTKLWQHLVPIPSFKVEEIKHKENKWFDQNRSVPELGLKSEFIDESNVFTMALCYIHSGPGLPSKTFGSLGWTHREPVPNREQCILWYLLLFYERFLVVCCNSQEYLTSLGRPPKSNRSVCHVCSPRGCARACSTTLNRILETKSSQVLWLQQMIMAAHPNQADRISVMWMFHLLHWQIKSISHVQLFSHIWELATCRVLGRSLCNVGRSLAMSYNLPRYSL